MTPNANEVDQAEKPLYIEDVRNSMLALMVSPIVELPHSPDNNTTIEMDITKNTNSNNEFVNDLREFIWEKDINDNMEVSEMMDGKYSFLNKIILFLCSKTWNYFVLIILTIDLTQFLLYFLIGYIFLPVQEQKAINNFNKKNYLNLLPDDWIPYDYFYEHL